MQDRYLNPFTDFGFKKLFGEEANKDLLIDFLNSLLYEKHKQKIKDLTFKKTENLGSTELDRKAIFDLYCEDEIGQKFIVELQKAEQRFFKDRTIYYSTFAIQEQAKRGDWSYELSPVYCISILDFIFNKEEINKDKYLSYTRLIDEETKEVFYEKLLYVYIEIPKFSKTEKDLTNNIDKWLYFLKYLSKLDEIPSPLHTEMFIKAFEIAEITNFTQEQRLAYEDSIKYYRDLKNVLDKSFDDGKQVGKLEGEIIGIEKGKVEGEIIGIEKTQKETVINMNKLGMSLEIISQVTSLSIEKIRDILNK